MTSRNKLTQREIQRKMKLVTSPRKAYKELVHEFIDLLAKMDITHLRSSKPHPELDIQRDIVLIRHEWGNFRIARDRLLKNLKSLRGVSE